MTEIDDKTLAEQRDYWHSKWFYARTNAEQAEAGKVLAAMDSLIEERKLRQSLSERSASDLMEAERLVKTLRKASKKREKAESDAAAYKAMYEREKARADRMQRKVWESTNEAVWAWEEKGPTSLTVAQMAEALYAIRKETFFTEEA